MGLCQRILATFDIFHALMKGAEIGSSNIILNNPLGCNRKLMTNCIGEFPRKKIMGYLDVAG